ncbi:MAG: ABC transporter permease [Rhodobiaceae bacterium]|nr:ABC transporter permease [Rhodobiaceae bacterium]
MSTVDLAPPASMRRWTTPRIAGWLLMGAWFAAGAALAYYVAADWNQAFVARYAPRILGGLLVTLALVALSITLGAILAQPIAFARNSTNPVIGALSYAYVYFFRGTPLLAQVFLVYYGAGQFRGVLESIGLWWFFREAFYCAAFAFTLNTAAYQAEIYRGAINSVPKGQWEAGRALGLPDIVIFFKVIMPQAAIIALRPLGNEIILMVKASAIASVVTVLDLMGETKLAFSRSYDFQVYIWAALVYLIIVEVLRRVWDVLEFRLTRHLVR